MAGARDTDAGVIAARLDRLPVTRTHRLAVVVVGIGLFFDIYEIFLAGTLASVLTDQYGASENATKWLLASAFLGMFIGALLLPRLADRAGRRTAFYLTLSTYSLFSLLAAFSPNLTLLVLFRFLAGLGIGAEPPLCDAYLSDLLPARVRGRAIAWAYTLSFLAVPAAGFMARGLVPQHFLLDGWRWMFVIGALGAAICWVLRRNLPESPRWLEAAGRHEEAEKVLRGLEAEAASATGKTAEVPAAPTPIRPTRRVPVSALFARPWRRRTLMLWAFHCLQTLGYYGFGSLVPLVLVSKGYSIVDSLTFAAFSYIGYPVGALLSLPLVERLERKHLVTGSAVAMAVFGLLFGYSSGSAAIVITGFLYTATSNLFSNAYHVYQGELYPTALRATGAGVAYSISRLASGAMPFVLVPLLNASGATAVFVVVAIAMVLVALDILVLGPATTGRRLEEITEAVPAPRSDGGGVPRPAIGAEG